ncbi:MAG: hypothetical protein E7527_02830 [Ruminococcaceae bacterium]|nr:hypothetical protein [Oscillospiraceae bacterium]
MKSTFRHYAPVALLLAGILAVSTLLSLLTGSRREEQGTRLLVTNYPLYVAAQNILGDTDGVTLTMLSGTGSGCVHDRQLTPADRRTLEQADMVIINGAGEQAFLEGVDPVRVVNTSAGLYLLQGAHRHEGEGSPHETANEHVWVSPSHYIQQVTVVRDALIRLDPPNAAAYTANAEEYRIAVDEVAQRLPRLSGRPCVLFHDSLAYLAGEVGLDVKLTLTVDGDSGIDAESLAQVESLAKQYPDLLLLYDTQYPIRYGAVDGLVPAEQVLALESAVVGQGSPTDWLDAMGRNADKLCQLTGGDAP